MDEEQYVLGIATAEDVDEILQKAIKVSIDEDDPEMLVLECYNPN
jgi:hypothetical protein